MKSFKYIHRIVSSQISLCFFFERNLLFTQEMKIQTLYHKFENSFHQPKQNYFDLQTF